MKKHGFSLIELMIVVAIIAILAAVAAPTFTRFIAKAKRAEAYMNLNAIYAAEKAYFAENGKYSNILIGQGGIGWKPEGYKGGGEQENFYYTYGFGQGSEGSSYFTGKLKTSSAGLSVAQSSDNGFIAAATGDIMNNGKPDIITIDDSGKITLVQDALAY